MELFLQLTALRSALKNLLKGPDFLQSSKLSIQLFFVPRFPSFFFFGNLYFKGSCLNFLVTMPVSEKKYLGLFCIFLHSLIVLKHIPSLAINLFSYKRGCEASVCLNQWWLLTSNSRNARSAQQKGGGSKVCSGVWAGISLAVSEYKRKQMT